MALDEQTRHSIGKAIGRIPSGVFILTAVHDGKPQVMMASWVQQASFDPPSVSIAIAKGRPIAEAIKSNKRLALSVIPEGDTTLMKRFARGAKPDEDPFHDMQTIALSNGVPAPAGALGYLEGELLSVCDFGGDHEILIAKITNGAIQHAGAAFTHQRGSGFHY